MIGKTNSSIGVKVNVTVVGGTTQPVSPDENAIWVNTSVTITKWTAQYDEPSNPVEGQVWVITNGYSAAGFSPIPDDVTMIYPVSAKIYHSSAWVRCSGSVYTGGSWHPMRVYYYDNGDELTGFTGGWTAGAGYSSGSGTPTEGTNYVITRNTGTGNKGISITAKTPYVRTSMYPANKVDLTHISTLHFKVQSSKGAPTTGNTGGCFIGVVQNNPGSSQQDTGTYGTIASISEAATMTLDVSALTGEYYVRVGARMAGNGDTPVYSILYEVYGD